MTLPKRPLPSLRFVIRVDANTFYSMIPQTTPKGRVLPNLWAVPGERITSTDELIERCKRHGWTWKIIGDAGGRRRHG